MHQRARRIVGPERVEHLAARDGGGERQRPAGERFRQGDDVGHDAGRLAGEHRAGASKAGEDLVEDQEEPVPVRHRAQAPEHRGIMEAHAAGALRQRLDDNGGDLARALLQ